MTISTLPDEVRGALNDGTPIRFRPIRPSDKRILEQGFALLSPESRRLRFFRTIDHLTESQLAYLTEVDFVDHVALIALIPFLDHELGVGVGRWIRLPDEPEAAEGAITVIDAFQHRGVGTSLLWLMARTAVERGVHEFKMSTLAENKTVIQLMKEFGAAPGRWESGVLEMEVPLPATVEELERSFVPPVLARGG